MSGRIYLLTIFGLFLLVVGAINAERVAKAKTEDLADIINKLYFATGNEIGGEDHDDSELMSSEIEADLDLADLSQRVSMWCKLTGSCNGPSSGANNNKEPVQQPASSDKNQPRSVGSLSDMCKMYKGASSDRVPLKCRRELGIEDQQQQQQPSSSSVPSKRAASSLRDLCKFYGLRCKRGDPMVNPIMANSAESKSSNKKQQNNKNKNNRNNKQEQPAVAVADPEEDQLYEWILESFLNQCQATGNCDFRNFLASLNHEVRSIM